MRSQARHSTTISPRATAVHAAAAGVAHDRDDLLDRRRIGRVAPTLVTRRATSMKSRQRRRRTATTGSIQQQLRHGGLLRLGKP
jgi:hypothetical protein